MNQNMLKWFGHMGRMDEVRLTKGLKKQNWIGRPKRRWTEEVGELVEQKNFQENKK